MTTVRMRHLLATVGLITLSLLVLMALILSATNQTLARTVETSNIPSKLSATGPISIPLVHPVVPIASPPLGTAQFSVQPPTHTTSINAIPFRPQVRMQLGATPPNAQPNAFKPGRAVRIPDQTIQKPQPSVGHPTTDIAGPLKALGWNILASEDFEGAFPWGLWSVTDRSPDGKERMWGDTSNAAWTGYWSAWPAAHGADALDPSVTRWYTDNLYTWMEYGPVDLSGMYDAFASFEMYYYTEPDYDWVYFCISTDQVNYNCDYWSGYSFWADHSYWLTYYAGYSQVWFAWVFYSDSSVSDNFYGPYIDDIYIWGNDSPPTPPVQSCALDGQLIQNCDFETGDLSSWGTFSYPDAAAPPDLLPQQRPKLSALPERESGPRQLIPNGIESINLVTVTTLSPAQGSYDALLWQPGSVGVDRLYQIFNMPGNTTNVTLDFWYAVTTLETNPGADFLCGGITDDAGNSVLVDLGCMDATDTDNYWHEYLYTLNSTELNAVRGKPVAIVFDLWNTGEANSSSAGWIDFVRVHATGGTVASIDPNEPNDTASTATSLACGQVITTGIIGDAVGGTDVDWFRLSNVPTGTMNIDIDARTQAPQSDLDSVVYLYDNSFNEVAYNDDDDVTLDSYVSYTNTVAGATYYARVSSYTGQGGPSSFYAIKAACDAQGEQHGGTTTTPGITGTWTVMLYLNAEDAGFADILTKYRTDIESFIGSKQSFLTVTVLYDPPGNTGTTRYLVQPNGNYINGVSRWNLAEANMGDPDTLNNFVSWSMDQFPANHYYLAIDDHGNGAYGISFDATSLNDPLTAPEIYSALKAATQNGARQIDILDYEACLMGLAENAYDVRSLVHYLVASEQISWGINTYPTYFSDLTSNTSPLTVGQRIVTRYSNTATAAGYPHTIALIDTTQLGTVNTAVNNFANALISTGNYTAVLEARANSQAFAADAEATDAQRAEYIDLWSLADHARAKWPVFTSIADDVKSAVSSAVIIERHASGGVDGFIWDHSGAHGLSIYYPATRLSSALAPYTSGSIYQMSADGLWDEFLQWSLPGTQRAMHGTRASFRLTGGTTFVFKYVYLPLARK